MTVIVNQELLTRFGIFITVLLLLLVLEYLFPRRENQSKQWLRKGNNLLLGGINTFMARFILPLTMVGIAEFAIYRGWGVFNAYQISFPIAFIISILLLDLVIYLQHLLLHRIDYLWHIHRVHHTDKYFDVTTAIRFHPIEIAISILLKIIVVLFFGIPPIAAIVFEILLSTCAMFNHSNIYIPPKFDHYIRWILVTPDMHRIHHSNKHEELNMNYGFCLSWWDRIFHTYRRQPGTGHREMDIGINEYRDIDTESILNLLLQPYVPIKKSTT